MEQANLIEIFESLQGEGPYAGEPMVFVRFQGCALACAFCDTPASFETHPQFRVERSPRTAEFIQFPNPVSPKALSELVAGFKAKTLSVTGGEPLHQASFLKAWLPLTEKENRVLLETNGVLVEELKQIIDGVDIISMDIKLPSATGTRAYWEEHAAFLEVARQKEVYVKVVLVDSTSPEDLESAIQLVQRYVPEAPFILQPVTPHGPIQETIRKDYLQELFELSQRHLSDVRIVPQLHVQWGIL
ncbi:MAG: 7-carboxy-7-deazaguanine synthase QueE [bacterium]|nr:7-carboxy-7-deazaguanine synthase QueE [bacterium]